MPSLGSDTADTAKVSSPPGALGARGLGDVTASSDDRAFGCKFCGGSLFPSLQAALRHVFELHFDIGRVLTPVPSVMEASAAAATVLGGGHWQQPQRHLAAAAMPRGMLPSAPPSVSAGAVPQPMQQYAVYMPQMGGHPFHAMQQMQFVADGRSIHQANGLRYAHPQPSAGGVTPPTSASFAQTPRYVSAGSVGPSAAGPAGIGDGRLAASAGWEYNTTTSVHHHGSMPRHG